jgi:penicillin-binding protein 1A
VRIAINTGVWGLGFGVWGLGFGVWGLGFGVWGLGFGVWGLGFGVWGLGFGVWGLGGAESYLDLKEIKSDQDEAIDEALQDIPDAGDLIPALVLSADAKQIKAYRKGGEVVTLTGDAMKFAARMLDDKAPPNKRLRRSAIIRLQKDDKGGWQISQLPEVESAFVAVDPKDGAIRALVGGFDFNRNKFNHVTQAWRQPGSSFKPFIYSASLEKGYSPGTILADEPIVIPASQTGSQSWEPHNYDGKYEGPMPMRTALAKSKNMVSIRILQSIGTQYAQDYAGRFGFDPEKHPPYLTMALGAGSVTPWQMVTGYAVFANGGYKINPFIVREIRGEGNQVLAMSAQTEAGDENIRAIDPRNAFMMDMMLRDVTIYGTAAKASVASSSGRIWPARRARLTNTSMPGSAAIRSQWPVAPGSDLTSQRNLATRKPVGPRRCRSGSAICPAH